MVRALSKNLRKLLYLDFVLQTQFVGVELIGDAINIVGQGVGARGVADYFGFTMLQTGEKILKGGGAGDFGMDAGDGQRAVVVEPPVRFLRQGSGNPGMIPCLLMSWS